jgi:phosphoribosylformimino-5-aminoimidazole carboxamide ribotide isomerase
MIIYPAIDLRGGRCVRLQQGDVKAETVFAADPVEVAQCWAAEGAAWLHIVNLDGALGTSAVANLAALKRILATVEVSVQFGGGLRSVEDIKRVLDLGVARVVLGTVAVRQPEIVSEALARYGAERVAVGIDARDGQVAIQGWVTSSGVDAITLAQHMRDLGISRVVYTDIARDGMLNGINAQAAAQLGRATGLHVIASGGVASLDDVRALIPYAPEGIEGVIIGMALYQGTIHLAQALCLAQGG